MDTQDPVGGWTVLALNWVCDMGAQTEISTKLVRPPHCVLMRFNHVWLPWPVRLSWRGVAPCTEKAAG